MLLLFFTIHFANILLCFLTEFQMSGYGIQGNPPEIVYEIHGDYGMKEWLGTHLKVFHIDSVAKVQS